MVWGLDSRGAERQSRRQERDAECVEGGWVRWGVLLPSRLQGVSGEPRELPQRGPRGEARAENEFGAELPENHWWQ